MPLVVQRVEGGGVGGDPVFVAVVHLLYVGHGGGGTAVFLLFLLGSRPLPVGCAAVILIIVIRIKVVKIVFTHFSRLVLFPSLGELFTRLRFAKGCVSFLFNSFEMYPLPNRATVFIANWGNTAANSVYEMRPFWGMGETKNHRRGYLWPGVIVKKRV